MKSIFSQMSKLSLFNHVMRLAMTCALCFITITAFGANYYSKATADIRTGTTGSGKVYVSTTEGAPTQNSSDWADKKTATGASKESASKECTYYFYAKADAGSCVYGWHDAATGGSQKSTACDYSEKHTTGTNSSSGITRYAEFRSIVDMPNGNEIIVYLAPDGDFATASVQIKVSKSTALALVNPDPSIFSITSNAESVLDGGENDVVISVSRSDDATQAPRLGVRTYSIGLRPSSNISEDRAYNPKEEIIYITVRESPIITFKPAVVGGSYTYQQVNVGGGELPVTQEFSLGTSSISEGTIKLVATPATNYRFKKWIITETNTDGTKTTTEFKDATKTYAFTKHAVVEAEFIEDKYAQFIILGEAIICYDDLNEAIAEAQKKNRTAVAVYNDGGYLAAGTYDIPAGFTFLVPGKLSEGVIDYYYLNIDKAPTENDFAETSLASKEVCRLTVESGTTINVNGGLCVYGVGNYATSNSNSMKPGTYGMIELQDNSVINMNAGSTLHALGYITNVDGTKINNADLTSVNNNNLPVGKVVVHDKAVVYEIFKLNDWRGGTIMTGASGISDVGKLLSIAGGGASGMIKNSNHVFPLSQYYIQNVEAPITYKYGAKLRVSLITSMMGFTPIATVDFIVPNSTGTIESGLFRLGDQSQLTKYYDAHTDRIKYILEKVVTATSESVITQLHTIKMVLNVNDVPIIGTVQLPVASSDYVLPIVNNMDVYIRNKANLEFYSSTNLDFLVGSMLDVDNTSTVTIKSNVYVYDKDQIRFANTGNTSADGKGYVGAGNATLLPLNYRPYGMKYTRSEANIEDAKWNVNGIVNVEGTLCTTLGGANITSDGSGKIVFTKINSLTPTYQAFCANEAASYYEIPTTRAKLHNDENKNPTEPYTLTDEASANSTYTYVKSLGKWLLPQSLRISSTEGDSFAITLPKDTIQNVVCNVQTDDNTITEENFKVTLVENDYFSVINEDITYDPVAHTLSIPVKYSHQNKHNVDNCTEVEFLTVKCFDLTSIGDEPVWTEDITLKATEDYKPKFKVAINGTEYINGATYPTFVGKYVDDSESLRVVVSAESNNVANALAEWTKVCNAPFAFDYGAKTETPYANATLTYNPTTAGLGSGSVAITATYTDGSGTPVDSTITIYLNGEANRKPNPLDFAQFPQPIYTTTSAFELIDAATNLSGADIDVTPKTGVVEITGTGKLDDPYIVTPKSVGAVTITATQKESRVYDYKEMSTTISILAGISPVPFCVRELNDFNNLLFNSTNVSYNTTNNTIDFNSTAANSEWVFRFKGTPDKLTFTPIGNNVWNIQQRSSEDADWQNILVWSSLTSGEEVSFQLEPTTCQVRIQYGSTISEIGTLTGVCVSELRIAADANKVYMPIKAGDTSEKKVVLTHTKNAVPTIFLSEGLSYTPEKTDNLGTEDAPYYKTTITLQTTESTTEKEYTLTATEDGTTITVIISAYQFPQELPIKLATDKPDNGDRYYFVTTASNHVQWDAANRQVVFQNPGTQQTRTVTFAFNGAPSIISFDAYSTDGAEVIVDSVWTIEESVNGVEFYPTTLARDSVESNKLVQELNYTTRYVRVKYNSILLREIRLSNLVIEGYPKVIVTPESMRFTTDETDLNPKKLEVIAINLQELSFELENTNAFQISMDTTYATSDWHSAVTANETTHASALGINKVDTIFLGVKWLIKSALDEGNITIRNKKDNSVLAVVPLMGSEGYLTQDNANNSGIYTGIPEGNTYHGVEYKDYQHHQVNLTNAFAEDGTALFDYLFIYGETTPADGKDITAPKTGSADGSTNIGSNAVTPYYIYQKALNSENQYKGYQFMGKVDNANTSNKQVVAELLVQDTEGTVYIDVQEKALRVYMTGFCPYATTGHDKNQEGVFLFRGKHGTKLDIYLEDFHVFSRNKTEKGNGFYGDKEGGAISTDGYARGSGGVLVFENVDPQEQLQNFDPFEVTIHTIGDNLLNSNFGCFFAVQMFGKVGMKATQVSSPIHVHMHKKEYARKTKTTLNFTDEWPTIVDENGMVITSKRTNGFLALKKQANNAPSIDMGNKYTTVNFKGGRVELQNSQIGSDTYKTTLAISHRSGYFGSDDAGIQLCYGIGTDSVGGTVNFYDGTVTVKPMKVPAAYQQYYLMDPEIDSNGDTIKVNGEIQRTEYTSCLRLPMNTYVYGGSHSFMRACQHVTSKGGAPKDGPNGSYLGQYTYTIQDKDSVAPNGLVVRIQFPDNVKNPNLNDYLTAHSREYYLESVAPDAKNKLYFWIPDGYGGVTAEQDKLMSTWKACMTEIGAGLPGVEGRVGGDTPIEENEEVKYLMYCQIDKNIWDVITAGPKVGDKTDYTYQPPFEVPAPAKTLFNNETYARYDLLTYVSDSLQYQVTSDTAYTITDRVYYVTTATADIWQTFTAPFNVENIYVVESYSEAALEQISNGNRTDILRAQAAHNADFAAFFAVAMAMGTDKDFDGIYQSYKKWAYTEDKKSDLYKGNEADYNLRSMQKLVPYVGSNWREANFYLNENKGNWTLNDETGDFDVNWEMLTVDSLVKDTLLHKGKTYSFMFPYCPSCETSLEGRDYWDYWSGKFIIFESTVGAQVINGRDFLNDTISGNVFSQMVAENEVIVTGNSTFAQLQTNRDNVYSYNSYAPFMNNEVFEPLQSAKDKIIYPTTAFLYGNVPTRNGAPARSIGRTGKINYGKENTPTDVNPGGNIPTVGGGNDLFITDIVGGVNIAVAEPQHVRVMSATGSVIFSGMVQTAVDVTLPTTGVYVITGEKEVHKILH